MTNLILIYRIVERHRVRTQPPSIGERTPLLSALGPISSGISIQWSGAPEPATQPTDPSSLSEHGSPRKEPQMHGPENGIRNTPEGS